MSKIKFSPILLSGILVALFFAVALWLRVFLPYDKIFVGDWIKFSSSDAYYHMRLVDNLVHNFPHYMSVDPYFLYPGATGEIKVRFFGWLLATTSWVIGLGSPTQHTIDVVSVYLPAVLGALTVIPVYFIGKELFGRWAGVFSAGLLAISPGEFMGRSILGSTDYHVAETLFTTVTMLFLILAVKAANQRQLTFSHLKRRDWATIRRPLVYSLLAGIFLGIYIFTWLGALLFVFITFVYFAIQFIIDHLKHKSTDYLCFVGIIFFSVTLLISLLISVGILYLTSLIIALLILLALSGVSRLMASKKIKPAYYPLALLGLGLAGVGLFYLISPSLLSSMLGAFSIFAPTGAQLTTMEMQPLISTLYGNPFMLAWGNFPGLIPYDPNNASLSFNNFISFVSTSFFLSCISLGILIYFVIKQGSAEKTLLIVWSLVILAATIGQRRFGYYFAVNVALLTGYLSVVIYYLARLIVEYFAGKNTSYLWSQILEFTGFKGREAEIADTSKEDYYQVLGINRRATNKQIRQAFRNLASKHKSGSGAITDDKFKKIREAYEVLSKPAKQAAYERLRYGGSAQIARGKESSKRGFRISINHISVALAVLVILLVVFAPNILFPMPGSDKSPAIDTASAASFVPSDAWVSSLTWLRENTPEPFGDPDAYYQLHELPPPGESYKYPESAYGVLAWWDYGYWITRIAHRIPNANPSQSPQALTSVASFFVSQDEKSASKIPQELNSAYVMIDNETAISKFWAIATWAGREPSEYFDDSYLMPQENQLLAPIVIIHPEYYRSLAVRLYSFDGKAVTPTNTIVISYRENPDKEGNLRKIITSANQFSSYEEAEAYLSSQNSTSFEIIGTNPMISPVPLEALEHYKLVHSSDNKVTLPEVGEVPAVKIFEYVD